MSPILTGILFVLMCGASTGLNKKKNTDHSHFTATLPANAVQVGVGNVVRYSVIVDNPGNDYDATTGTFTVPETGLYSLSVSMMSGNTLTAHLTLRRNGQILVWLYTGKNYDMASQTINVQLTAGNLITVQMNSGTSLFSVYNTFSAALISTT